MTFAVRADFLLGFYQGRNTQGQYEKYPAPARLFSALLSGVCSLERNEGLEPSECLNDIDDALFQWLGAHPPAAIALPEARLSDSKAISFRDKGEVDKGRAAGKKGALASCASFLDGPIVWYWDEMPSQELIDRLGQASAEVPYLGEAAARVALTVHPVEGIPEDAHFRTAPIFNSSCLRFETACQGRMEELQDAFVSSSKKDRDARRRGEFEHSQNASQKCIETAYYKTRFQEGPSSKILAPWRNGLVVHIKNNREVALEERCAWAEALHRALVSNFGDSVPCSMLHAKSRANRPANSLAIQVIDDDMPVAFDVGQGSSFIVMVPNGAPNDEEERISRALGKVSHLYKKSLAPMEVSFEGEIIDLATFWLPPSPGAKRLFRSEPLFVVESRSPLCGRGSRWSLSDAAKLAVGYTWRDSGCFFVGPGDSGRAALADAVAEAGVSVLSCRRIPTSQPFNYTHKVNKGSDIVCGTAVFDLAGLHCDTVLAAIGQSRHFGTGLLVPFDSPNSTQEE